MVSLVPAAIGVPGGVELIVIFIIFLLLFGVPLALALLLGYKYVSGRAAEQEQAERIAELESEIEELREAIDLDESGTVDLDAREDVDSTDEVADDE